MEIKPLLLRRCHVQRRAARKITRTNPVARRRRRSQKVRSQSKLEAEELLSQNRKRAPQRPAPRPLLHRHPLRIEKWLGQSARDLPGEIPKNRLPRHHLLSKVRQKRQRPCRALLQRHQKCLTRTVAKHPSRTPRKHRRGQRAQYLRSKNQR